MADNNHKLMNLNEFILGGILFYFFLHSVTTLVESIYLLDLLNTQLDEKVLGLLFFFSTPFFILIKQSQYSKSLRVMGLGFIGFRVIYPFFSTAIRILFGGIALGFALMYYPLYFQLRRNSNPMEFGLMFSSSIGFGTLLSILFRSLNSTWDVTEIGIYRFITLLLGLFSIYLLLTIISPNELENKKNSLMSDNTSNSVLFEILGVFSVFILIYFVYGSPGVISRWTEFPYILTIAIVSVSFGIFLILQFIGFKKFLVINFPVIIILNILFFSSLILVILLNQVTFLENAMNSPILVDTTPWIYHFPLVLNLLLSPILLINLSNFSKRIIIKKPPRRNLVSSFLISESLFVILIFMMIFTNVWGYVEPISLIFRGLFWLPFLIIALVTLISLYFSKSSVSVGFGKIPSKQQIVAISLITILMFGSLLATLISPRGSPVQDPSSNQLSVLTYNIQQGANISGDKNYISQLELIQDLNPDIIGLQESDIAKINTGNTDIVRFFSENLGYYSYYGPKTVMQTYGVALLSRYPIINPLTFFTIGNVDEIGSIRAQIEVNSVIYTIFVNHPAGSDEAKWDHTDKMLELAENYENVILMGDFNWREDTLFYASVTNHYLDTWRTKWPSGVDDRNINMSSTIDHIFVSPSFSVIDATYIPSPQSQTDHPAFWVVLGT